MYGPDFKTILNEYAEITGRMEMYGKWAYGFMLSKYGNDNATQAEFLEWINRLRTEGYPSDCYVFDYGWRGDIADSGNYSAGMKFGKQMWSNDTTKFPDVDAMFEEARSLGFHVGLHNNDGTPEAKGGTMLYDAANAKEWVESYMAVVEADRGDWFLVASATDTSDTVVSVWLPPETTWYNYYSGETYTGGENGETIRVSAALDEIPVFVKAGAIVPMGPDVNYADEKTLDPLTLDIYPSGTTSYTLFGDDGVSRRYITDNAYTTTCYTCVQSGKDISFSIGARVNHNENVCDYLPESRTYNLKFGSKINVGVSSLTPTFILEPTFDASSLE